MRIELRNHPEAAPGGCPADEFVPYIDTFLLRSTANPLGGVLVLPGGGYRHRAYHEGNPVAEKFNAMGYHAFVLQYRVAPYRYPAPQRDVLRAVKIIRSHAAQWRLDKLAVLGFSAGGHLAASSAMLSDRIDADENDYFDQFSAALDAMILCYPVISLTDEFGHIGSGVNLFGEDSAIEERAVADMQKLVDASTPPSFLWHTATDQGVDVANSVEFARKMWQCGNTCELHVFPAGPHGRGLGDGMPDVSQWAELAGNFLELNAGFTRR